MNCRRDLECVDIIVKFIKSFTKNKTTLILTESEDGSMEDN